MEGVAELLGFGIGAGEDDCAQAGHMEGSDNFTLDMTQDVES